MDNEANKPRHNSEENQDEHVDKQSELQPESDSPAVSDNVQASVTEAEPIEVADASAASNTPVHKPAAKNEAWEWAKALLIALGLVFVIRWFIFAPFIVDGQSMEPNFDNAERIIVNKILYSIREPKRGEVLVFHAPAEKDYIKRVIGLPGETVKVQGDNVYVNGQLLDEPYLKDVVDKAHQAGRNYNNLNYAEIKVPEGSIFVMGDNRSNSSDSRSIGPVGLDKIVGRADLIFWPAKKIHWIH